MVKKLIVAAKAVVYARSKNNRRLLLTTQSCTVRVCEWYLFDDPLAFI